MESVKGLRCNSLSCSSSISEVTTGPKQQHKDARWIRGFLSFYPSLHLFQWQHVLCTGIQKADDRRPNHTGSFSLSLFSFLIVTYSDMCVFFLLELAELISSFYIVTCLSNCWKRMTTIARALLLVAIFLVAHLLKNNVFDAFIVECRFDFLRLKFSKFIYLVLLLS